MKRVSLKVAKYLTNIGYTTNSDCHVYMEQNPFKLYVAPTYLDVWLWLWQEKGICIEIKDNCYYVLAEVKNQKFHGDNPKEVIIAAIEYLVNNDLIK